MAIDLNGKTITGDGSGDGITDSGVSVKSVAITNGTIKNFDNGINFFGSSSSLITLERITSSRNAGDGIFIENCCNSLTRIKANGNGGVGVYIDNCCNAFNNIIANNNGSTIGVVTLNCLAP